jgi:hypothetical protein
LEAVEPKKLTMTLFIYILTNGKSPNSAYVLTQLKLLHLIRVFHTLKIIE